MLTEYFDFDDPCVSQNDLGDAEDMISAFNFLKGLSYLTLRKNEETGEKYPYERHIVSNRKKINNNKIGRNLNIFRNPQNRLLLYIVI